MVLSAAIRSTIGTISAIPAGAMPTYCPISSAPRTMGGCRLAYHCRTEGPVSVHFGHANIEQNNVRAFFGPRILVGGSEVTASIPTAPPQDLERHSGHRLRHRIRAPPVFLAWHRQSRKDLSARFRSFQCPAARRHAHQVTGFGRSPQGRPVRRHRQHRQGISHRPRFRKRPAHVRAKCWTPVPSPTGAASTIAAPARSRSLTRSGNRSLAESNWSPWTPLSRIPPPLAAKVAALDAVSRRRPGSCNTRSSSRPPQASLPSRSPTSRPVYLPKNVAPVVEAVDITPANYRFFAGTRHHSVYLHHAAAHRPAED